MECLTDKEFSEEIENFVFKLNIDKINSSFLKMKKLPKTKKRRNSKKNLTRCLLKNTRKNILEFKKKS